MKRRIYNTLAEARSDILDCIELFYNNRRRHGSNAQLSPLEYEQRHQERLVSDHRTGGNSPGLKTLMRIPVAFRILFAVLISMYACLVHAQDADDHQYTSESIRIGYGIYGQQCRLCHGSNGDVVDGVNLRLGIFPNARSDEDLRRVITEGAAEGRMPAINISEQEVTGIIAYIRAGFNSEYEVVDIGDPVRGKALFEGEGRCASCHRVAGVGPRTAPDLSAIGLVRTATTLQLNMIDPAAALLPINKQVRIVTIAEETIIGRRLNEDTFTVQVLDSQERLRSLRKSDIATYEISDVPTKQPTTLSSEEVADVVAYLLTLRGL